MKKHVSLFLALLMVVSVFFAIPAEAEAIEQTKTEQLQIHSYSAPAVYAAGAGSSTNAFAGCAHTYRNVQYNSSQHKRICTKCGDISYANHSFSYSSCGNVHNKHCSCGYSVNESHTYVVGASISAAKHKLRCTKCGETSSANHSFGYTDCGNTHNKHCSCGYSANESHAYGTGVSISATSHKQTCTCGHVIQANHNWTSPAYYNSNYHVQYCTACPAALLGNHHYSSIQTPFWINQMGHPGIMECSGCKNRYTYGWP